jgi:hypothetical protein
MLWFRKTVSFSSLPEQTFLAYFYPVGFVQVRRLNLLWLRTSIHLFFLLLHLGQHLADASIFMSCAMSLAVFNVTKAVENGVVVEPVHEQLTGTIR